MFAFLVAFVNWDLCIHQIQHHGCLDLKLLLHVGLFHSDLDVEKPDERSIMTYIAQFLEKYPDHKAGFPDSESQVGESILLVFAKSFIRIRYITMANVIDAALPKL